MINVVAITGKVVDVRGCETHVVGVIESNNEQFYILFDKLALPEPKKILTKYVSISGQLVHFKQKLPKETEYTIELGIFVRRLEVYDV